MGETLPQPNTVRTSTYGSDDIYDPAYKSLKNICVKTLLFFGCIFLSISSWAQEFTGTGSWSIDANWTPIGVPTAGANVTISGNCTMDINPTVGNITINPGAVLDAGANTLRVQGNWTNNGTFTAGTSNVILQGATGSSVNFFGNTTFYNLSSPVGIKSNLLVFTGASVTVSNTNTLNLTGSLNNLGTDFTAGNGTINIAGSLINSPASTFSAGSSTISIGGNLSNDNIFVPGTSTIVFTSGGTSIITGVNALTTSLNNLTINKTGGIFNFPVTSTLSGNFNLNAGTVNAGTTLNVGNNFILSAGTFNANTATIAIGGAFTDVAASTFNSATSTVRLVGTQTGRQIVMSPTDSFYDVVIAKDNANVEFANNLAIRRDLIINSLPAGSTTFSAAFNVAGAAVTVQGSLNVMSGGIDMSLKDNTYLTVAGATNVSGGRILLDRLTSNSAITLNGGLSLTGGIIDVGTSTQTTQSRFRVVGNTRIINNGLLRTNANIVEFAGNVSLEMGTSPDIKFRPFNATIIVTGDWYSELLTFFDNFTPSTVVFTGINSSITGAARFANALLQKTAGNTVTNTSNNFAISNDLTVEAGSTLILKNVTAARDLTLSGNLTIQQGGSLDISDPAVVSGNRLLLEIGGDLTDLNDQEPNISPRRGLYMGMNTIKPMGDRGCTSGGYTVNPVQDLPTIRFTGNKNQVITGKVKLRNFCSTIYVNEDAGIALPNVIINKTLKSNIVQINSGVNLRIHGDLTIDRGIFNLNGRTLFYGDFDGDEIIVKGTGLSTTTFDGGTFLATAGSRIFMNTGGATTTGTFLKVEGGTLKLLGDANAPVVITREGTNGQYYRMAAYAGIVEAIYTNFSFQGAINTGFAVDPGGASWETNGSDGGFKIYSRAVIDPDDLGRNFSYCVIGANGAGGLTALTINTGQSLDITGAKFNTSLGAGNENCAKNNPAGQITFIASSGELGGVNGEANDSGSASDAAPNDVVWETFTKIYWVGGYQPAGFRGTDNTVTPNLNENYPAGSSTTAWSNPKNWSFERDRYVNPRQVFPGQTVMNALQTAYYTYPNPYPADPARAGKINADTLQQFEVFICATAITSPVVDGQYIIQGTIINNAVGREDRFDISPVGTRSGKRLDLNGNILTVFGDFVNNSRNKDNNTTDIGQGVIDANNAATGGRIRFKSNFYSDRSSGLDVLTKDFVLEAFGGSSLQEIKVDGNDLQELLINKTEGRIVVQGASNRLDVMGNMTILGGGFELLTETALRINGDFTIEGGFFDFNASSVTVRGNWTNRGGVIFTDAGTVNFYPLTTTTKTITSGGQGFNIVNFGFVSIDGGSGVSLLTNDGLQTSPAATIYQIVDNFRAGNLTTIAANGSFATTGGTYSEVAASQPRTVEVLPNVEARFNGLRIRENGTFIIREAASAYIKNTISDLQGTLAGTGIQVDGGATTASNGLLRVVGIPNVQNAKISRNDIAGTYKFKVNGTIVARYYYIEYTDKDGIDLTATTSRALSPGTKNGGPAVVGDLPGGGSSNPSVSSFSNGILTNGSTDADASYIKYLSNSSVFGAAPDTVFFAEFRKPLGTNGANIRRTGAACNALLWFREASGTFAGEVFDNDGTACADDNSTPLLSPSTDGQIRWRMRSVIYWDGGPDDLGESIVVRTGTDRRSWHTATNWVGDKEPGPYDNVVLDRSRLDASYIVIVTANAEVDDLDIQNENSPTAATGKVIQLVVNNTGKLTVNGSFSVKVASANPALAVTTLNNTSILNPAMIVKGSWDNAGTFDSRQSTVRFVAGASGTRVINNVEGPLIVGTTYENTLNPSARVYNAFHNVEIAGGYTEIVSPLLIKNNLTISNGATLDANVGSFPIFIEGNWLNAGIFKPQRNTVTFVGNKAQSIQHTTALAENFWNLTIEKRGNPSILGVSDRATMQSKATVANTLSLQNGRFIAAVDKELIMLTDQITRRGGALPTTAYVKGPLGHLFSGNGSIPRRYFLGDLRYPDNPVTFTVELDNSSPAAATVFTIEQIDTNPDPDNTRVIPSPLNYLSQSRYWKVKNIQFAPVRQTSYANLAEGVLVLPFVPNDERININTPDGWLTVDKQLSQVLAETLQASIVQDSTNYNGFVPTAALLGTAQEGTHWENLGGLLNVNEDPNDPDNTGLSPVIQSAPFSALGNGDFSFGFNFTPLPVELLTFQATAANHDVNLKWVMASEKNIHLFTLQRSTDGKTFQDIGQIQVKNVMLNHIAYTFTDKNLNRGIWYYRLKIVDKNYTFTHSDIEVAEIKAAEDKVTVYPNPFDGKTLYINGLSADENREAEVVIYDLLGKAVYAQKMYLEGRQIIHLQIPSKLTKGMYILNIQSPNQLHQHKILVK